MLSDWQMILLNDMKAEKFVGWNLFPNLVTDTKKNDIPAKFPLSCAGALPRSKKNGASRNELLRSWNFF